jgi:hypothetical protein
VRSRWAQENAEPLSRLVRAHRRAAAFVEDTANRDEVTDILVAPNRIGVESEVVRRTLDGRMKIAPDGTVRSSDRYLLVGRKGAARPDDAQAAWLYAQMVRWGQAPLSAEMLAGAKAVFRPDLFDAALSGGTPDLAGEPDDGIGAFAGPRFDANDIASHLKAWKTKLPPAS